MVGVFGQHQCIAKFLREALANRLTQMLATVVLPAVFLMQYRGLRAAAALRN